MANYIRTRRERWGAWAAIALPAAVTWHAIGAWSNFEFLAGKRTGLERVLREIGKFLFSPAFPWIVEALASMVILAIYVQGRRDRAAILQVRDATADLPPPQPQSPPSPPVPQGLPNWRIVHDWLGAFGIGGLDGVRLRAESTDGSTERIFLCVVTAPDGTTSDANELRMGSAFFGSDPDRLQSLDHAEYVYPEPHTFPEAPGLPLTDGVYNVEFWAKSSTGPGRILIQRATFEVRNGQLV